MCVRAQRALCSGEKQDRRNRILAEQLWALAAPSGLQQLTARSGLQQLPHSSRPVTAASQLVVDAQLQQAVPRQAVGGGGGARQVGQRAIQALHQEALRGRAVGEDGLGSKLKEQG